jgi:hypothetical protein
MWEDRPAQTEVRAVVKFTVKFIVKCAQVAGPRNLDVRCAALKQQGNRGMG